MIQTPPCPTRFDVDVLSTLAEAQLICRDWLASCYAEHRTPHSGSARRPGCAEWRSEQDELREATRAHPTGRFRGSRYRPPTLIEGGPTNGAGHARYERASLIVTSNKPVSSWGEIFGDDVTATAMIDRLIHHAEILSLQGDSYRLRDKDLGPSAAAD